MRQNNWEGYKSFLYGQYLYWENEARAYADCGLLEEADELIAVAWMYQDHYLAAAESGLDNPQSLIRDVEHSRNHWEW